MFKFLRKGMVNMNQTLVNEIKKMPQEIKDMPKITDKIIASLTTKEYPIPIVKIMYGLNFIVGTQELDDNLSGYIAIDKEIAKKYGNDRLVCVNSKDSLGHQRFTIAHELAHFLFDYNTSDGLEYYNTYWTNDVDDIVETRANKFAANLLMPENEFKIKYNEFIKSEDVIEKLVEYFQVPKKAILRRIIELGLN